jgi:alpha-D-ribose 1-methylphosphonate 5-triphosphate synthase subunit PhnG
MDDALPAAGSDPAETARRRWMAVLARAEAAAIAAGLERIPDLPGWRVLRGPESGLVMVQGRAGGSGAPFNLGEMSVTRCTVRTATGEVGHAYVAGRDQRRAELAAAVDALMQRPDLRDTVAEAVIAPLARAQAARREAIAAKAAATRVEFFAMGKMR